MTIPSPLSPAFAQLQPSESLILAFYALDSALQPTGVLVQCDTTQLDAEVAALNSLAPPARLQLALTLLQHRQP